MLYDTQGGQFHLSFALQEVPYPSAGTQFWNIKLVPSSRKTIKASPTTQDDPSAGAVELDVSSPATPAEDWATQEQNDTAQTLREKQKHVETQVYRIWTVLSTFEESSAACISEMLRHVSNGNYLDGVQMAERFVLHVETLFAAIDDLNAAFRHIGGKGKLSAIAQRAFLNSLVVQKCRTFEKRGCSVRRSSISSLYSHIRTKLGRARWASPKSCFL